MKWNRYQVTFITPDASEILQQQIDELLRGLGVGRVEVFEGAILEALPQHRAFVGEGQKAGIAKSLADAARADAAEGQLGVQIMQQRVVDARAAGRGVVEHPLDVRLVGFYIFRFNRVFNSYCSHNIQSFGLMKCKYTTNLLINQTVE